MTGLEEGLRVEFQLFTEEVKEVAGTSSQYKHEPDVFCMDGIQWAWTATSLHPHAPEHEASLRHACSTTCHVSFTA